MNRLLPACALAVLAAGATVPSISAQASSTTGYDISWPQCPSRVPSGGAFGIVGVTDGLPWSPNPCLSAEFSWAAGRPGTPALYMNTADPGTQSTHWALKGPNYDPNSPTTSACNPADTDTTSKAFAACAYDYGWNAAANAFGDALAVGVKSAATYTWWLDVETGNSWDGSPAANAQDIQGSIDYLHKTAGVVTVGVYSTTYQWGAISGGYAFPTSTPEWLAGANGARQAQAFCTKTPFGGANSRITLTQYVTGGFDADLPC